MSDGKMLKSDGRTKNKHCATRGVAWWSAESSLQSPPDDKQKTPSDSVTICWCWRGRGGGIYNFPNQLSEIREGVIMKNMLIIPYLSLLYHIHIMVNKNTMKNLIILLVLIIFLFKACLGSKYSWDCREFLWLTVNCIVDITPTAPSGLLSSHKIAFVLWEKWTNNWQTSVNIRHKLYDFYISVRMLVGFYGD